MRVLLAGAASPDTDFTFEATLAATAAAVVIAFAALRWLPNASSGRPRSALQVLLRRAELLVTMAASIGAVIVIFVALDALAKGVELSTGDRRAAVNVLQAALWLFFVGIAAERIGRLLDDHRTFDGQLTVPFGDQVYAAVLGIASTVLVALTAFLAADGTGLAVGLGVAVAVGLAVWGALGRMGRRGRRASRAQFLAFCHAEGLEPGVIYRPGQNFAPIPILEDAVSGSVYLTVQAAERLAREYERTRLQTRESRDLRVEWRPFRQQLRVRDERLGSASMHTVPLVHGLVRLDVIPRRHVLELRVV